MLTLLSALAFASAVPDEHVSLLQTHFEAVDDFVLREQFKEERFDVPPEAVIGVKGTNVCPDGSIKVASDAICQQIAGVLGYTYTVPPKTEFRDVRPGGCYINKKKKAFFNMAAGAAFKKSTPVCMKPPVLAAPPTTKPPTTKRPGKVARPGKVGGTPRNVCTILKCRKKGWECCFVPLMQRGRKVYGRRGEWAKPNKGNQQNCLQKGGQWCDAQKKIHGPALPPKPEKKRNVCTALRCKKKGRECCWLAYMQKGKKVYGRRGEWPYYSKDRVKKQKACLALGKEARWCDRSRREHFKASDGSEKVVKPRKPRKGRPGKKSRADYGLKPHPKGRKPKGRKRR